MSDKLNGAINLLYEKISREYEKSIDELKNSEIVIKDGNIFINSSLEEVNE